jgi:hypothetical protein
MKFNDFNYYNGDDVVSFIDVFDEQERDHEVIKNYPPGK